MKQILVWIIVILVGWSCRTTTITPKAKLGQLNASKYTNWQSQPLALDGEWHFSWLSFSPLPSRQFIQVPDTWHTFTQHRNWFQAQMGYGTYELDVVLPKADQLWSLHLPPIHSAYRLLVNRQLITQVGIPRSDSSMTPETASRVVTFAVSGQKLHLELQVANYAFATGGVWSSLTLGTPEVIRAQQLQYVSISIFLFGCLLIMGLYHIVLFVLRPKDQSTLYFGLLCNLTALRELFSGEALFFEFWPHANWEWAMKVLYSSFCIGQLLLILYCQSMFPNFSKRIVRLAQGLALSYCLLVLLTSNKIYGPWLNALSVPFLLICGYCLGVVGRAYRQRNSEAAYVLFGIGVLLMCFINDFLYQRAFIQSYFLLPFGLLLFLFGQSLILAFRSSNAFHQAENLYLELLASQQIQQELARKQQEAEQRRVLNDLKDRFFANITHEFRTPLTLIISPVEQLLRGNTEKKEINPALQRIKHNAHQLLHLVNQLLDLAKVEAGQMPLRLQQVEVVSFLEQRVDLFSEAAKYKNISLTFQSEFTQYSWIVDADKLNQILQNLLSNALKFTNPGGQVVLRLFSTIENGLDTRLYLEVQDTGNGIAEEHLPHLFNRFYQVESLASANVLGTGIGLSLAQELAQLMGVEIQVRSQVGKGSVFTLGLPSFAQTNQDSAPYEDREKQEPSLLPILSHIPTPLLSPKQESISAFTVLVVEDQPELLFFLVEILSPTYRVLTAMNGLEGWQICEKELPDLVLSDVMMSPSDGYALCRLIKETPATHHIAVILLTAKVTIQSKLVGLTTGANDYLTKPFDPAELLLRIENLLSYQQTLRNYYNTQLSQPASLVNALPLIDQVEDPFLRRIYAFLDQQLDNTSLSVEGMADHLAVSSRTLVRKITALTGLSTKELIRKYRLHKATLLLRQGYNVSETAYRVGFDDPSYFGQCFRELYQISPSEYAQA